MLAIVNRLSESRRVQRVSFFTSKTCHTHLETRDQPAQGPLNTRLTCTACGSVPRGSYPYRLNGWYGDFLRSLNRKTALRHTVRRNMAGASADASGASLVRSRERQYPRGGKEGKRSARKALAGGGFLFWSAFVFDLSVLPLGRVGRGFCFGSSLLFYISLISACSTAPSKSERFKAITNDTNEMEQLSDHVVEMRKEMHR